MERNIHMFATKRSTPRAVAAGQCRGQLVCGEIATDEVIQPGQRIQAWMIITNAGDTGVHENLRLSLRRADTKDGRIALERSLELTVPPGESRIASFDISISDITATLFDSRSGVTATGGFDLTIAATKNGDCKHAKIRLKADWLGHPTQLA